MGKNQMVEHTNKVVGWPLFITWENSLLKKIESVFQSSELSLELREEDFKMRSGSAASVGRVL